MWSCDERHRRDALEPCQQNMIALMPLKKMQVCMRVFTLLGCLTLYGGPLDEVYRLGPDSLPQEGVPKGTVVGPLTHASQVFPNTTRHYWVYVPAQYDGSSPARLMVFQDGHAFVLSLIHI